MDMRMMPEITVASRFITGLLVARGSLSGEQLQDFDYCLRQALAERYQRHWFPEEPLKGSGFRCIRINHDEDPLLARVAGQAGLSSPHLFQLLPLELTVWVDPAEVAYRIGEAGSIGLL